MNTNKLYILLTWLNLCTICKLITAVNHELILERVEVIYLDKTYADFNTTIRRINRFDYGVTFFLNLIEETVTDDDYLTIQLYTFHNNEFRLAPLKIRKTICSFLESEWHFLAQNLQNYGNFPSQCPFGRGIYYIKDYIVDASHFPDFPWDNMRFDVYFSTKTTVTAHVRVYIRFDKDAQFVNKFLSSQT